MYALTASFICNLHTKSKQKSTVNLKLVWSVSLVFSESVISYSIFWLLGPYLSCSCSGHCYFTSWVHFSSTIMWCSSGLNLAANLGPLFHFLFRCDLWCTLRHTKLLVNSSCTVVGYFVDQLKCFWCGDMRRWCIVLCFLLAFTQLFGNASLQKYPVANTSIRHVRFSKNFIDIWKLKFQVFSLSKIRGSCLFY